MIKRLLQTVRRPVSLLAFASLMILVFALAACGGDSGATASTSASSGNSNTTSSSSSSSSAASTPASVTTVNIVEKKGANSTSDVYSCDPATITVKKGDTVTFTNQSDEIQDFDQGDAQKAGVDFKMNLNQSTTATFKTAGTFNVKSEKGASITVTVQ